MEALTPVCSATEAEVGHPEMEHEGCAEPSRLCFSPPFLLASAFLICPTSRRHALLLSHLTQPLLVLPWCPTALSSFVMSPQVFPDRSSHSTLDASYLTSSMVSCTRHLVDDRFVWHNMGRDISHWLCSCHACQVNKVRHHHHSPVLHTPVPTEPFTYIHVDLDGLLPPSSYLFLFTIIDRFSRWPEVISHKTSTNEECASALMLHWVARFCILRHLTSNRSPQFTSALWSSLASTLRVELHHTSVYPPQANGVVERFHCSLKASLLACFSSPSWFQQLPGSSSAFTPASAVTSDLLSGSDLQVLSSSPRGVPSCLCFFLYFVSFLIPCYTFCRPAWLSSDMLQCRYLTWLWFSI